MKLSLQHIQRTNYTFELFPEEYAELDLADLENIEKMKERFPSYVSTKEEDSVELQSALNL